MTTLTEQLTLTWDTFSHPSGVIEVRALVDGKKQSKAWEGWGDTICGYFDDKDAFIESVTQLDKERNVGATYVMMNPIIPALMGRANNRLKAAGKKGGATSDADIVSRHRLLIDTDPIRPSQISATEEELCLALAKRDEIVEYLCSLGFPDMWRAVSGNGGHAIGAIDLPNTEESTKLVSDFLAALSWKFGDDAIGIDTTVANAARITKLYGTVARKGDNTDDRPHRRAKFTYVPEIVEVIPAELLEQVAQEYRDHVTSEQPQPKSKSKKARQAAAKWSDTVEGVEGWFAENGVTLKSRQTHAKNGYEYMWDVDCLTCNGAHTDGAIVMWGAGKGLGYRCHHDSCKGKSWSDVRATIAPKPKGNMLSWSQVDVWREALDGLGYDLKLNLLEDTVEVDGVPMDDIRRSQLTLELYDHAVKKAYIDDLLNVVASEQSYHPIQEYLTGLQWDGNDHVAKLLHCIRGDDAVVTYPDGTKAPLHWLLIRRWLLGCVARGLDGDQRKAFKHQTPMLVIIGAQGLGKSSFCRWLVSGVGYEFHQEGPVDPHSVEDKRSMVTKWIWEVSELGSSLRKSDRDALKGFITQEWHTYRKPWGRSNITKPTLCNLVGTINPETGFLDDPTGHRRFLPVRLTQIDRRYSDIDVNQLWAQLVHMYRTGTSPELSQLERQAIAETYKEHEIENPLQTYLQMYFDIEPGNELYRCHTAEIIQRLQDFDVRVSANVRVAGREVNDALAPMGLIRKYISIGGVKGWGWYGIRPNDRRPGVSSNVPDDTDDTH